MHHLNETATAVWELLDGTRTADDVVAVLADAYQVPTPVLGADVVSVLSEPLE